MTADEWCDIAQDRLRLINQQERLIKVLRSELGLAADELERGGNVLAARAVRIALTATP